jgi:hypothetical protein
MAARESRHRDSARVPVSSGTMAPRRRALLTGMPFAAGPRRPGREKAPRGRRALCWALNSQPSGLRSIDGQPCRHVTARGQLARLAAVPCLVVSSCRACGTGTALRRRRLAVPCLVTGRHYRAEQRREESRHRRKAPCPSARCRGRRADGGGRRNGVGGGGLRNGGGSGAGVASIRGRRCGRLRPSGAGAATSGGGLRSGGEGRSCGGFDHQGEEQRCQGQELGAATAGVERGGSGEERKKIRIFMFLWAVGCR